MKGCSKNTAERPATGSLFVPSLRFIPCGRRLGGFGSTQPTGRESGLLQPAACPHRHDNWKQLSQINKPLPFSIAQRSHVRFQPPVCVLKCLEVSPPPPPPPSFMCICLTGGGDPDRCERRRKSSGSVWTSPPGLGGLSVLTVFVNHPQGSGTGWFTRCG